MAGVVIVAVAIVLVTLAPAPRGPLAADDPSRITGVTASPPRSPGSSPDRPASPVPSPDRTPSGGPSPDPSAGVDLSDLVVRDGDGVVATGVIVVDADGLARFCAWKGSRIQPTEETGPGCGPPSVPVAGFTTDDLPGWTEEFGGGSTGFLRATGTWADGVLHVSAVQPTEPIEWYPRRPVPCAEPAAGWPGVPTGEPIDIERTVRRLATEIESMPDKYSGYWSAYIDPDRSFADGNGVIVVGVVGDPADVADALAEIYPYNLCVVPAQYSAAELAAVEERLGPPVGNWQPDAQPPLDRVVLRVPLVDEATVARIGGDAELVLIEALVRKR